MSRRCQLTGKGPLVGNHVSHSNIKSKTRQLPNLQSRRYWLESERRWVRLQLSARALRTVDKIGVEAAVEEIRHRGGRV